MKISELIKILETLDGETTIVVARPLDLGDWIGTDFEVKVHDGKAYVWYEGKDDWHMEERDVSALIWDVQAVTPPGAV